MAAIDLGKGLSLHLGLAVAILAFAASNSAAASGLSETPAQQGADFVCHGFATQTCYFAVLRQSGSRTDFTLARGATFHISDVAKDIDRYMVAINFAPPENAAACLRTPAPGKRSAWCKLSTVTALVND